MAIDSETTPTVEGTYLQRVGVWLFDRVLSVPVRVKITGIILLPVIILGLSLNYWVTTGLADWLSYQAEQGLKILA